MVVFEGALAILHGFRMAGFSGGGGALMSSTVPETAVLASPVSSHDISPAGGAVYSPPKPLFCWPDRSVPLYSP